jgi:hypothetical protein
LLDVEHVTAKSPCRIMAMHRFRISQIHQRVQNKMPI